MVENIKLISQEALVTLIRQIKKTYQEKGYWYDSITVGSETVTATANSQGFEIVAGDNISLSVDNTNGTKIKVNNTYALPVAAKEILGGIKPGNGVSISNDGTLSVDINAISGDNATIATKAEVQAVDNKITALFKNDDADM